jgi:hypothetical protein
MNSHQDSREKGTQPLDQLILDHNIPVAAIIHASPKQLTFKNIKSARYGRYLSRKVREKILFAFNNATKENYQYTELFNYK